MELELSYLTLAARFAEQALGSGDLRSLALDLGMIGPLRDANVSREIPQSDNAIADYLGLSIRWRRPPRIMEGTEALSQVFI